MTDLFISYAREDEARIRPLVSALEQQGWSVFWDHRIPAGQTWRTYIGRGLKEARCVIVAWSQHSVTSKWVTEEADEGQKRDILIPVLLDSVELPMGFRSVQAADLTDWQPEQPSPRFQQLVQDIKAVLESAPTPQATGVLSDPVPQARRQPTEPPSRPARVSSRHFAYALLAIVLVVVGVGGYWGYQRWFSSGDQTSKVTGLRYFRGAWENIDPETRGITRLEIRTSDATVFVHVWGKCHPTDCDWGEVKADAYAEGVASDVRTDARALGALFKTSFKETIFDIRPETDDRLRLETATRFTDNSSRASFSTVDVLQRAR